MGNEDPPTEATDSLGTLNGVLSLLAVMYLTTECDSFTCARVMCVHVPLRLEDSRLFPGGGGVLCFARLLHFQSLPAYLTRAMTPRFGSCNRPLSIPAILTDAERGFVRVPAKQYVGKNSTKYSSSGTK